VRHVLAMLFTILGLSVWTHDKRNAQNTASCLSFFFKLASSGVIFIDECHVLLYLFAISSRTSMYFRVELAEKILKHLFFHSPVPSLNNNSFSVKYKEHDFDANNDLTSLL